MASPNQMNSFFLNIRDFPPLDNGKINLVNFLEAAGDLVLLVERLGKIFAPVKYDMQGNINKVKKFYVFDEESCLLEVMLDEVNDGKYNGLESILWLNRAILFFELIFQEILKWMQTSNCDINMTTVYIAAYEGSVKKYHNWITQQIFAFICRMSPSFSQILVALEVDNDVELFKIRLAKFRTQLSVVRCKIDDFFKDHQLFQE